MNKALFIPAAGIGKRMNSQTPKQFLEVNGKSIIAHTLEKFFLFDKDIKVFIAINEEYRAEWMRLLSTYDNINLIEGGSERFYSVQNMVNEANLNDDYVVGVHDAVRPMVNVKTIKNCFNTAEKLGSSIPIVELKSSIRFLVDEGVSKSVERSKYRIVQTPQCFHYSILKNAYKRSYKNSFTDDASVVESAGFNINLVNGNEQNIKITNPLDLNLFKILINE